MAPIAISKRIHLTAYGEDIRLQACSNDSRRVQSCPGATSWVLGARDLSLANGEKLERSRENLRQLASRVGARVDAIEEALLGVVGQGATAAATRPKEAGERRDQVLRDALSRGLEEARYAAGRAFRQYDAADPANRLLASELAGNRALVHVPEVEGKLAAQNARTPAPGVAPASLGVLASNLRTVWSAPTTDARVKKRIGRTLIHESPLRSTTGPRRSFSSFTGWVAPTASCASRTAGADSVTAPLPI